MFNRITAATLTLGLCLASGTAAAVDSTAIFKAPIGAHEASKSKTFGIDPELGRAWVEISVYHDRSENSDTYRVAVPGLRYDSGSGNVVYEAGAKQVVCANTQPSGFWVFKSQRVVATGDCELTRKYVSAPVDDGFSVQVIEHFEVYFKPAGRLGPVDKNSGKQG